MRILFFALALSTSIYAFSQSPVTTFTFGGKDNTELTASLISNDESFVYASTYGIWSVLGKISTQTFKNIWEIEIESDIEVVIKDIAEDESGNIYALLCFRNNIKLGEININTGGRTENGVLVRFDKNGKPDTKYLLFENLRPGNMVYHPSSGVVLSLVFRHKTTFMGKHELEGPMDEVIIAAFDDSFQNRWVKQIGGDADNSITAMTVSKEGDIYLAGTAVKNVVVSGIKSDLKLLSDIRMTGTFISRFNAEGKLLHTELIPSSGNTIITSLLESEEILYAGGIFSWQWKLGQTEGESPSAGNAFLAAFNKDNMKINWFLQGKCEMESIINDIAVFNNKVYATGSFFKGIEFAQLKELTDEESDGWRFMKHGFVLTVDMQGNAGELNIIKTTSHSNGQKIASNNKMNVIGGNFSRTMNYGTLSLESKTDFTKGFAILKTAE